MGTTAPAHGGGGTISAGGLQERPQAAWTDPAAGGRLAFQEMFWRISLIMLATAHSKDGVLFFMTRMQMQPLQYSRWVCNAVHSMRVSSRIEGHPADQESFFAWTS